MRKSKEQKAITLIALIITIVVLLILAAVAISSIQENGILGYAQNAADNWNKAQQDEANMLGDYLNYLNNMGSGSENTSGYEEVSLAVAITNAMYDRTENSQTKDIHGNIIKIPAGFKILVDDTTVYTGTTDIAVEKGIVIIDEAGNEFVYVPVGEIKTASTPKTITLARYEFDIAVDEDTLEVSGTGAVTAEGTHTSAEDPVYDPYQEAIYNDVYFVEGEIEGVDTAKGYALSISDFYSKASSGYYIGRYEARTTNSTARTSASALTAVTTNKANAVYNYITQPDATDKCQSMYTNKPFTTDLVNSFAWDTAIVFIQSFEDSDYSMKTSVNESFENKGTTEDKVCNIYDMASNCFEWSTETTSYAGDSCTARGGNYYNSYASYRENRFATDSYDYFSFRPVLYL